MKSFIRVLALAAGMIAMTSAFAETKDSSVPFRQEGIASWYGAEFEGRLTASGEVFDSKQLTAAHPRLPFGTALRVTNTQNGKMVLVRVNDRGPFVASRIIDVSRAAAEKLDMLATGTAPVVIEAAEPLEELAAESADERQAAPAIDSAAAAPEPAAVQAVPSPAAKTPQAPLTPAFVGTTVPSVQTAPSGAAEASGANASGPAATAAVPAEKTAAGQQAPASKAAPAKVLPAPIDPTKNKKYRLQVGSYKAAKYAVEAFDKLKSAGLSAAYEKSGSNYRVVVPEAAAADIEKLAAVLGAAGFKEVLARELPVAAKP